MATQSPDQVFQAAWNEAMADGAPATTVGAIRRVEYRAFVDQVLAADPEVIRGLVRSMYRGDIYIFLNAFDPAALRSLKNAAFDWSRQQPAREPVLDAPVADYRSRRDWHAEEKGGYSSTYDMLHFYRWNDDPLGVFTFFAEQYRLLRMINGYPADAIASNRPADGIVDRVEISHYPRGIGGIAFHSDPLMALRFQLTLTLTEFGQDFKRGGFAVGSSDGGIVQVEPLAPLGSLFGFLPSVCHGVEVIDPDLPADWDGPTGRWYASISTVTTAVVPRRESTKPVAGYPTLRQQIDNFQRQGV